MNVKRKAVHDYSLACTCDDPECTLNHQPRIEFRPTRRLPVGGRKLVDIRKFETECKYCLLLKGFVTKGGKEVTVICGDKGDNSCLLKRG